MSSSDGSLISFRRVPPDVRPRAIERVARSLRERVARGREFHCRITGDTELRRLNRDFLGHDYATDVLSFPSGESSPIGDLAISIQRARAQARRFGHPVEQEIAVLMLHGVLHLLGMDHEIDGGKMARAEARWRRELGLPGGLIERSRTRASGADPAVRPTKQARRRA
jgi:probable rRNA maturation factor